MWTLVQVDGLHIKHQLYALAGQNPQCIGNGP